VSARLLAAAATTAATAALLAVPADAALPSLRCRATAETPYWEHSFGAVATGAFACDGTRPLLGVEVCLESLLTTGWTTVECGTGELAGVAAVSPEAQGCHYGAWLIRTVARGWSSEGETGWATSVPVPYLCTPLA
jgi:hypothetical protein